MIRSFCWKFFSIRLIGNFVMITDGIHFHFSCARRNWSRSITMENKLNPHAQFLCMPNVCKWCLLCVRPHKQCVKAQTDSPTHRHVHTKHKHKNIRTRTQKYYVELNADRKEKNFVFRFWIQRPLTNIYIDIDCVKCCRIVDIHGPIHSQKHLNIAHRNTHQKYNLVSFLFIYCFRI